MPVRARVQSSFHYLYRFSLLAPLPLPFFPLAPHSSGATLGPPFPPNLPSMFFPFPWRESQRPLTVPLLKGNGLAIFFLSYAFFARPRRELGTFFSPNYAPHQRPGDVVPSYGLDRVLFVTASSAFLEQDPFLASSIDPPLPRNAGVPLYRSEEKPFFRPNLFSRTFPSWRSDEPLPLRYKIPFILVVGLRSSSTFFLPGVRCSPSSSEDPG